MDIEKKSIADRSNTLPLARFSPVKNFLRMISSYVSKKKLDKELKIQPREQSGMPDTRLFHRLQSNVRGTLLTLIRKESEGSELSRPEWGFIAYLCYQTYNNILHKISFIDRDLVAANMLSFAAVIALRDSEYPDPIERSADGYYFGNMNFSWVDRDEAPDDIQSHVTACVDGMPAQPSIGAAIFSSRNFDCALRDEPPLDIRELNKALRPYLKMLLLVCIRGYWDTNNIPIITPNDRLDGWRKDEEEMAMSTFIDLKPISNQHWLFSPHAEETIISGLVSAQSHPFIFGLNDYVELTDFMAMIEQVGKNHISIPGFELHILENSRGENNWQYMLATGRWRHFFSAEEFDALRSLFRNFREESLVKTHLKRLEMIYGRV